MDWNQLRARNTRRRLTRFGDARELDGPLNARQPYSHVSDDLRWAIVGMSELYNLQRNLISLYTSVPTRTINRILLSWQTHGGVWGHHHGLRRRSFI